MSVGVVSFTKCAEGNWQWVHLNCWIPADVCEMSTELLCVRQVFDFVDILLIHKMWLFSVYVTYFLNLIKA